MSKRLILILVLAFVVGITVAAFAEVQNVKISGDIKVMGISRNDLILRQSGDDTGTIFRDYVNPNEYESPITAILSQIRVRVDADLTDNVSTTVRLLNERVWGEEGSANSGETAGALAGMGATGVSSTDIDLDLAYATLKEFIYSPLTLTVGRQELRFGNALIIGDVDTNNFCAGHGVATAASGTILPKSLDDLSARKSFDAVRATLNYDPLVVDMVYAKIDENTVDQSDDVDLYGMNANYALDKVTTLEGYYWEKRRAKVSGTGTLAILGGPGLSDPITNLADITRVIGARVQYTGISKLFLSLEGAYQFGRHIRNQFLYPDEASNDGASRQRDAYAVQLMSNYDLSAVTAIGKYLPTLGVNYTVLSGDPYQSRSKHYRGWDPMFEDQSGGTLFNKIFAASNCQVLNVAGSMQPLEDVKLTLDYYYLRLIKAYRIENGLLVDRMNLTGVFGDPTYVMKAGKKNAGTEIDAAVIYDYTEDVQLGLSYAAFMPGNAFTDPNSETAQQVIGSMKVTF